MASALPPDVADCGHASVGDLCTSRVVGNPKRDAALFALA